MTELAQSWRSIETAYDSTVIHVLDDGSDTYSGPVQLCIGDRDDRGKVANMNPGEARFVADLLIEAADSATRRAES